MTIKITPNDKGNPPGKLADAELHFSDGPLEGLKLIGFAIWERRGGNGRNVTFPARSYVGERRAPHLRAAAPDRRHDGTGKVKRADPRGISEYAGTDRGGRVTTAQPRESGAFIFLLCPPIDRITLCDS